MTTFPSGIFYPLPVYAHLLSPAISQIKPEYVSRNSRSYSPSPILVGRHTTPPIPRGHRMHSYASLLCLFVGYVPWSPWGFIHGAVAFQADPIGMRYEAAEAGEALWMAKRQDLQVCHCSLS